MCTILIRACKYIFYSILSFCMVSIQEQFLIKSRIWCVPRSRNSGPMRLGAITSNQMQSSAGLNRGGFVDRYCESLLFHSKCSRIPIQRTNEENSQSQHLMPEIEDSIKKTADFSFYNMMQPKSQILAELYHTYSAILLQCSSWHPMKSCFNLCVTSERGKSHFANRSLLLQYRHT